MKSLKTALLQLNPTVGALGENAEKIINGAETAYADGARLLLFPELVLTGYPPEDLVLKPHFLADCEIFLQTIAQRIPADTIALIGIPVRRHGRTMNSVAIINGNRVAGYYSKMILPNYGVFDEQRVFSRGRQMMALDVAGMRIGLHICEDTWQMDEETASCLHSLKLTALVNLSASPYHSRKVHQRTEMLGACAERLQTNLLYCNLVGGQDELVFDGGSMVFTPDGKLFSRCKLFEEDSAYVVLEDSGNPANENSSVELLRLPLPRPADRSEPVSGIIVPDLEDEGEVCAALKLGLRDYVTKNGFKDVVIAVSGGIDSALVMTLAVDALGAERVHGVTMPSPYTSAETLRDSEALCGNLRTSLLKMPITDVYGSCLKLLNPLWPGMPPDLTEENIQARLRGLIIMAISNKYNRLVLSCGNKSELATGYCTLYGDMAGGFSLLMDVPKTLVYKLCRWRNKQADGPLIPETIISRPPSAELRPDQKDSDSLPPYDELDPILERYVELDQGLDDIVAAGFDRETTARVIRLVDRSEYKRRQNAPGIKITPKAFGKDRRLPITNRYVPGQGPSMKEEHEA